MNPGSGAWPRVATTGTRPSGTAGPKTRAPTRSGRSNACRRAARLGGAGDPRLATPGRCVAGAGCSTGCAAAARPTPPPSGASRGRRQRRGRDPLRLCPARQALCVGAAGPGAFDCSGLTMMAWAQAGVSLPHSSRAQFGVGPSRGQKRAPTRRSHRPQQPRSPTSWCAWARGCRSPPPIPAAPSNGSRPGRATSWASPARPGSVAGSPPPVAPTLRRGITLPAARPACGSGHGRLRQGARSGRPCRRLAACGLADAAGGILQLPAGRGAMAGRTGSSSCRPPGDRRCGSAASTGQGCRRPTPP